MSRLRLTALVLCLMAPTIARAADGGVYLYLQPLPPEAARLTFAVVSVAAVTGSGSVYPLDVRLKEIGNAEGGRQRLLASGRLPEGSYAGFVFTVGQATLKGDQGPQALAVPATPVRLDVGFTLAGRRASVVWLTLRYQDSLASGSRFAPVFAAVIPPGPIAGNAGFVSNARANTITVFDKHLNQAVSVIDTCAGPSGMALDQRRRRVYVACSSDEQIQSIDIATGDIVERAQGSPGDRPREVALTPDGSLLVAVNAGSNSVSIFDAASLIRQDRVSVGNRPGSLLVEPSGRRAFVFNTLSSSVSVIDLASRSLVATMSTESAPLRGRFDRRGDRLYVIHERSPYMTVLDPQQLSIVTRVRLRTGAGAIEVDPVRHLICIGGAADQTIEFYDGNALMPLYSMRARAAVSHMTIDAESSSLYMVSPDTRSVFVARLADRKIVSEIDVGDGPYWVAVMGEK